MSDDYEAENSPNEEELMADLDAYLSGAPMHHVSMEDLARRMLESNTPPSILEIQLAQSAERIEGRRRVDGEGRGFIKRPMSPLENELQMRVAGLSPQGRAAVIAAMEKATAEANATAAQIVSEAEAKAKVIIDPPRSMEPENVDRMIADALENPSPLPKGEAAKLYDVLRDMQKAIGVLRGFDDPIIKRAVTDLEMAAIGVAMQAERHG